MKGELSVARSTVQAVEMDARALLSLVVKLKVHAGLEPQSTSDSATAVLAAELLGPELGEDWMLLFPSARGGG